MLTQLVDHALKAQERIKGEIGTRRGADDNGDGHANIIGLRRLLNLIRFMQDELAAFADALRDGSDVYDDKDPRTVRYLAKFGIQMGKTYDEIANLAEDMPFFDGIDTLEIHLRTVDWAKLQRGLKDVKTSSDW